LRFHKRQPPSEGGSKGLFMNMDASSTETASSTPENSVGLDFLHVRINQDNASGRFGKKVHTRFPPEPNGYLHIGHAKSICINFGLAQEYGGLCNLRFDDTNPVKEDTEYVDSIREDVHWLGGEWDDREYYASNYFDQLYAFAEQLIRDGKAYVDSQSAEEIRASRGTLTQPGTESPYRNRSIEENLDLFHRMRDGEFADGEHVLRAKIDMASPNVVMRDPTLYRIRHAEHHRTGDKWCVYPMYDFTHCLSDSLEGITHSICTLEFVNNRELYDWVLDALNVYHPQQIEFARLGLTYTVLSKRKLIQLVKGGFVRGWDDPRMPTICGMRRRGYTPEAIRDFCSRIGVARAENLVEYSLLEFCVREHLNAVAPRTMAVLDPIKVVIENYPEGQVEWFDMPFSQDGSVEGSRKVPFSRELYIERDDFREDPPKKFHRLFPGSEVRLRYAYYVTCKDVIKDADGNIVELRCTYDPESKGGATPDGRKIKGTIHWVSVPHAVSAEVRLYEHLFTSPTPGNTPEGVEFTDLLNPGSMRVVTAQVEPALAEFPAGSRVQFERLGYFCVDPDSKPGAPVFNRTVTLKDSWAKIEGKQ
jgi:glutaminyl-tRNA synthetase